MSITTFEFGLFVAISVLAYYIFPVKWRWITLFVSSCVFVFLSNSYLLMGVMLVMIMLAYIAGRLFEKFRDNTKACKRICVITVILLAGMLIGFREINFFISTGNIFRSMFGQEHYMLVYYAAPLGISYYTLTLISYVCDAYWEVIEPEHNPIKFISYASFYPLLTSGPILSFSDSYKEILAGHSFDINNIILGVQRIVWGLFKKLVICERIAVVVNAVYDNPGQYNGFYVWIAVAGFALQLYTDFSGCIDILLGVAELYGMRLPENFDLPFMSTSLAEFWRHWHITLGGWLKIYILYPILKSKLFQKMVTNLKKKLGKEYGKKIPTWIGTMISWFMIGFWHGGTYNYIWGVGIFFGIVIVSSEILTPIFKKWIAFLNIDTNAIGWKIFQRIRTFCFFSFGLSFFRAKSVKTGFDLWKQSFAEFNPWIFFDGSLFKLGLDDKDVRVLLVMLGFMMAVGLLRVYLKKSIREWLAEQGIVFRWLVYLSIIFIVIIYGQYGPFYDASAFIYGKF